MTGWTLGIVLYILIPYTQSSPVDSNGVKKPFTIEEAILGHLSVKSYSGKWISDTEIEYFNQTTKDVSVFNVAKNQTDVVLKGSVLQKYNATKYEFSPDRTLVLLCYDEISIYRHSRKARYVVYSIKNGIYYELADYLQVVEWSPKNNTLVFIKDNNIYLIRDITRNKDAIKITDDGQPGVVFNGISDWVYEEEILSSGRAFQFSPEGDQLIFITFFDTKVKKASISEYGEPGDIKNQYTYITEIRYPKAGSTNPTYELRHVFLQNPGKITVLAKYEQGKEIIYDFKWVLNDAILYLQTNRVQNESKVYLCDVPTQKNCRLVFQENVPKGWAITNLPIYSKNLKRAINIQRVSVGKNGTFKHLVFNEGSSSYPLTYGLFEVVKIVQWDENNKIIYYLATEENDSVATQLYYVSEVKGSKPVCLSCRIKSPEGQSCKDASALFSKNSSYLILNCNGPDPRTVYLYKNVQTLSSPLKILENNSKVRTQLRTKILPEVMNLTITVPGPFEADVRLLLPPSLDRSGKTKYPLLIYVYGGPASKNINNVFKPDWGFYMSTNLSVIYGFIDGRNTLRKGDNMLFAGYRALGTLEMEDQINVTRTLQKQFPFIDSSRTGIWGWSYGGYATTKILELDTRNVFKCGVAVAPVADWIYYDSMYTERYMGLPQENQKGYEKSSVLKDVSNLRNKEYFLIHGNADDNVHYQNAMMIAKLLERKNIPFEQMSYPDEDHSLQNVRPHLYYTMSRFWKKCFNLPK